VTAVAYWCLWLSLKVLGRLLFRLRAIGREYIPEGGVLIAANHASFLDIPLLGCSLPRRASFLGRQDLFAVPGFHWMFRKLGWIPIRLSRLDREGFGKATGLIKSGNIVVIYPEGTRTADGNLQPGKPGVGVIVEATGCPVVPVYLDGTYKALPTGAAWIRPHPVRVIFGKPIDFSADAQRYQGKDFYQHVSRTVMEKIAELGQVPPPVNRSSQSAAEPFNAE
jgi:1-acyl-sn-glycerol-3-phosphate acyltransferase